MNRPLTGEERTAHNRRAHFRKIEESAIRSRGEDKGSADSWLQILKARLVKDARAGNPDIWSGWVAICRMVLSALQRRAAGDRRIWDQVVAYAEQVCEMYPPE
ncbi:hypothetical protein [Kitasatospora sp. NPDC088134]|uniref:hypothetical protein n=1 Tax=Kitasatospora sp. NPDC088134 TaxID=3364071 RepID=UPI003810D486